MDRKLEMEHVERLSLPKVRRQRLVMDQLDLGQLELDQLELVQQVVLSGSVKVKLKFEFNFLSHSNLMMK